MAFADIALGAGIVSAVGGIAGTAYSLSGAGQPQQPNLASSSRAISDAEASLLPQYRQLAAAAQEGQNLFKINPGYTQRDVGTYRNQLQSKLLDLQKQEATKPAGSPGMGANQDRLPGQIAALKQQIQSLPQNGPIYLDSNGQVVPASQATSGYDFSGHGAADIQADIAKQMAGGELGLAQKYDPAFIAAALQQEQLANPEGAQARQRENQLIQQQINQPIANPVAQTLTDQVQQQVTAGKGLDEFTKRALDASVAQALAARGGAAGSMPGIADDLTTGAAGTQRQLTAINKGVGLMTSGTTPQDVAYRREQQNLANLSNEISGQTPTTEFKSLSGAQTGPTPTAQTPALPLAGQNELQTGAGAGETQYAQQIAQPNPWLTGITSAINLGTTASNLGWSPLAPTAG